MRSLLGFFVMYAIWFVIFRYVGGAPDWGAVIGAAIMSKLHDTDLYRR